MNSEKKLLNDFLENGYIIVPLLDMKFVIECQSICNEEFNVLSSDELIFIHKNIDKSELNEKRLSVFKKLNNIKDWEKKLYLAYKYYIDLLLGSDLSIQLKLNPSIQMPNDETSILEMHTDSLSGQSYFECVFWTPLTQAYESNSMFIFDLVNTKRIVSDIAKYERNGMEYLFNLNQKYAKFIDIKPGNGIIFSSTLLHGNILNTTNTTRFSVNCRFKNLFSPEFDKYPSERKLGSFYKVFKMSPVSLIAANSIERNVKFK
jgi:sporadic carbohydrate cluster 2OG-Fe(II) oxygenase